MRLCMKVHGVHKDRVKTAAVSFGTSHVSAVSTSLWWMLKNALLKNKANQVESHVRAVTLLKSGG